MRSLPIPKRFLDWRWLPAYAALVALLAFARPAPATFALGAGLMLAGAALRVWSAGHLVKTRRLTRSGPYAYLRHPLYAGTLLIGVGFFAAAGGPAAPWAAAVLLPIFFGYYLPNKERIESARLERRYGDTYRLYHDTVPALVPRRRRWPPPELCHAAEPAPRWSARRFLGSSEGWALMAVTVALGVLCARAVAAG